MDTKLKNLLDKYAYKIAQHTPKTISDRIREQERPTVPASESKEEQALYDELLGALEPEKAPEILTEEEARELEDAGHVFPAPFKNPPAWVASEKTWDEAKKAVRQYWEKQEDPWGTVAKVYFEMGGKKKKRSDKNITTKLNKKASTMETDLGEIKVKSNYSNDRVLLIFPDTTPYLFTRREAAQLAKMLSDEALKMIDADLKAEMPDDTNDAKFHSLEEKKKIEKEHPGKWIVYVNGDTNPELEFSNQNEAMEAAKNEWEASLLGDVNVSVAWSADDDDPRFGDVSFTPFYELGRIDNFGRWRTAWDRI